MLHSAHGNILTAVVRENHGFFAANFLILTAVTQRSDQNSAVLGDDIHLFEKNKNVFVLFLENQQDNGS